MPGRHQRNTQHERNTAPMRASPRCGAKTRTGKPCQSPIVRGRKRCRMHGGAKGSGAPPGNQNALKHGLFTRQAKDQRKMLSRLLRESEKAFEEIE